jgi:voltage-gated potassium channel
LQSAGVLFSFLLGLIMVGLQRRKGLAWLMAVIVTPALATCR